MYYFSYGRDVVDEMKENSIYLQISYGQNILDSPPHRHDFYEFIYVIHSSCVHVVNEIESIFSEGEMIVLRPGDTHYFKSQTKDTSLLTISVTCEKFQKFITPYNAKDVFFKQPHPIRMTLNMTERLYIENNLIPPMSRFIEFKKQHTDTVLCVLISIMFLKTSPYNSEKPVENSFSQLMIQMNQPDNIKKGMDALFELTNLSSSSLYRLFKNKLKITPIEFVTKQRMQYAYDLISYSNQSLEDICEQIGYQSFSHFVLQFQKTYKKTPSAVRKEALDNIL
ncbi:MAG: helix-turn-helix domain-containing protein [Acutalibacteraceae bacterium]